MIVEIWIVLLLVVFSSTWLATVERAMIMTSPLLLRHEMEIRGTPHRGLWIEEQYESVLQSISVLKGLCFLLTMYGFILLFGNHPITISAFVSGSVIAWVVIWVFASVIAGSIAQAVPVGSVTRSWFLIRLVSVLNPLLRWWVDGVSEIIRRLTGANLKQNDGLNLFFTIDHHDYFTALNFNINFHF